MPDFSNPRFSPRKSEDALPPSIVPNVPPTADFSSSSGGGHTMNFQDLSFDPDGQVVAWSWNFGDQVIRPTAAFVIGSVNGLTVSFTNQSTPTPPATSLTYLWNFGDGATSTSANPSHTYASGGTYDVSLTVTDNLGNASAQPARRTVSVGVLGRMLGVYEFMPGQSSIEPNLESFNGGHTGCSPSDIIARINFCRQRGLMWRLTMTGGAHANYITNNAFDPAKWKARLDLFCTPTIIAAVKSAYEDGIIPGHVMIDEPNNGSWGGVITKAMLDDLATYAHASNRFPFLPMGVVVRPDWRRTERYHVVDFAAHQYSWRFPDGAQDLIDDPGNVSWWIDYALNIDTLDGVVSTFQMNVLDGGLRYPEDPAAQNCPVPYTGGPGTLFSRNNDCRMTAAQLTEFGVPLLNAGQGLNFWRYDSAFFADANNKAAFASLRNTANGLSRTKWSLRI